MATSEAVRDLTNQELSDLIRAHGFAGEIVGRWGSESVDLLAELARRAPRQAGYLEGLHRAFTAAWEADHDDDLMSPLEPEFDSPATKAVRELYDRARAALTIDG